MPRGEETQEEGRDQSEEIQKQDLEQNQEVTRDQEVVAEPEAVVERERPVEESEAIEAAVVEVVEAVTEDRGSETEDGDVLASENEGSATPIPLPTDPPRPGSEEVSVLPIPLPSPADPTRVESPTLTPDDVKEDGGREMEDGETAVALDEASSKVESPLPGHPDRPADEISTNPVPLPGQPDRPADEISSNPIPLPGQPDRPVDEISTDPIPMPGQPDRPADEISTNPIPLPGQPDRPADEISINPVPMPSPRQTGTGVENNPIPMPSPVTEEGEINPLPLPTPAEQGETSEKEEGGEILDENAFKPVPSEEGAEDDGGQETEVGTDEGGSILIGEDGSEEIEQIDLTEEASKEVEEYWEPPEIYVYKSEDGSISIVDSNGKSIDSPPQIQIDKKTGAVTAWYAGSEKQTFTIPAFERQTQDLEGMFVYTDQDGKLVIVDKDGKLITNPPSTYIENGKVIGIIQKDPWQTIGWEVPEYTPPTQNIFAYTHTDGSVDIVDKNGELIKCPPHYFQDGADPTVYLKDPTGIQLEIPAFTPSHEGIYLYKNLDGSYSVVDENGKQVKSPPHLVIDGTNEPHIKGENDQVIKLDVYKPSTTDVYAYTGQDGSVYMVDKDGNQINSPPHYDLDVITGKVYTKGKDDSAIEIQSYQPPIKDMFIHLNQDGSIDIVDQNGMMIKSPPNITIDINALGKPIYNAKYSGMPWESSVQLNFYKPPSSHWDKK